MSGIGNLFYRPRYPALKYVTYVLSNGASVRLNIATEQKGPRFSNLVSFIYIYAILILMRARIDR
jgi:hypothetical protein